MAKGFHVVVTDRHAGTPLVQAVQKAALILRLFKGEAGELSLQQIAEQSGMPRASAHRLLVTLCSEGLLEQDERTKRFRLGMGLAELGSLVLSRLDLRTVAAPYLDALSSETAEAVYVAVASSDEVVHIDKRESRRPFQLTAKLGTRAPMYCTALGKAILAYLPEDELASYLARCTWKAFTPSTITSAAVLGAELSTIQQRGYALDMEEFEPGLCCAGVPLLGVGGRVLGALSVATSRSRRTDEELRALGEKLAVVGDEISRKLGYARHG